MNPTLPAAAVVDPATGVAPAAAVSAARANYILLLVTLVYAVNFIDRNILNVLLQPIKEEFALSDTMLGFMSGIGFTTLYVLASLPLARLADRTNRVAVICGGLTVWSAMTALCGLAGSATQLVLARCMVGVGEASSGGPGQAVLTDVFPPEKRARAMSVLSTATFFGVLLAFVLGSAINARHGWRAAFIIVGLPGLLLAALIWFTVREVPRGGAETKAVDLRPLGLAEVLRFLAGQRSVLLGTLAFSMSSFCSATIIAWVTPLLQRVHGLSNAQAGMRVGPILGLAGIAGGVIAALIMTRLSRRDMRWTLWATAASMLVAAPAFVLFCFAPTPGIALAALAVTTLCSGFQIGPFVAALQSAVKVRMRALTGACNMAATTMLGWGLGPLAVGMLSDALQPRFGVDALRYALLCGSLTLVIGAFLALRAARHLPGDIERCT
ncbi:MAG TPA: MFS transporter [Burkholderiaceae bacterium]|nr:MFS transporter [Burkholderiaceae bacterium]